MDKTQLDWKRKLPLFGLLLLVVVVQVWATHRYMTSIVTGGNDFYSRWHGARVLLLEGQDPYDLAVTEEIQIMLGATHQAEGRSGFHYPLHVIFLFWPLVYLSYPVVQAIWMTVLIWIALGTVLVMLAREGWRPEPAGLAFVLLATITLYPVSRTVILGQFTLHVTFFLALTVWAWRNGRFGWAGLALSATSIKPQMIVLVGVLLVLLALRWRLWRFFVGVVGGGLGLLGASLLVYPRWVLSFIDDVQRYADVAGGRNPLVVLGDYAWGGVDAVRYLISVLAVGAMLYGWWRAWQAAPAQRETRFELALWWTVVVSVLVPFQTGTTNQVLLLIVFIPWLRLAWQRWGATVTAVGVFMLVAGLWVLFLATISGDFENPLLFVPLPVLTLLVLVGLSYREWHGRSAQPVSFR